MTPAEAQTTLIELFGSHAQLLRFFRSIGRGHRHFSARSACPPWLLPGSDPIVALLGIVRDSTIKVELVKPQSDPVEFARGSMDAGSMLEMAAAEGMTIVLRDAWSVLDGIAAVRTALQMVFWSEAGANIYWSPSPVQAFPMHSAGHDAIAVQLYGRKKWSILSDEQAPDDPSGKSDDEPVTICALEPGDVLYLPAGLTHTALADSGGSVHVTVGFRPMTLKDIAHALVDLADEDETHRGSSTPRGLSPAVPEFLRGNRTHRTLVELAGSRLSDSFRNLAERLDSNAIDQALGKLRMDFLDGIDEPEGQQRIAIDRNSPLRLAGPVFGFSSRSDGKAILHYPGGRIVGPEFLKDPFDFIVQSDGFCLDDLPGGLSPTARMTLAEKLIRHGILVVE